MLSIFSVSSLFFFDSPPTTEIYTFPYTTLFRSVWVPMTLDAERGLLYLPISTPSNDFFGGRRPGANLFADSRSEEHTSELQSRFDLVCRLLLEKKKS